MHINANISSLCVCCEWQGRWKKSSRVPFGRPWGTNGENSHWLRRGKGPKNWGKLQIDMIFSWAFSLVLISTIPYYHFLSRSLSLPLSSPLFLSPSLSHSLCPSPPLSFSLPLSLLSLSLSLSLYIYIPLSLSTSLSTSPSGTRAQQGSQIHNR